MGLHFDTFLIDNTTHQLKSTSTACCLSLWTMFISCIASLTAPLLCKSSPSDFLLVSQPSLPTPPTSSQGKITVSCCLLCCPIPVLHLTYHSPQTFFSAHIKPLIAAFPLSIPDLVCSCIFSSYLTLLSSPVLGSYLCSLQSTSTPKLFIRKCFHHP